MEAVQVRLRKAHWTGGTSAVRYQHAASSSEKAVDDKHQIGQWTWSLCDAGQLKEGTFIASDALHVGHELRNRPAGHCLAAMFSPYDTAQHTLHKSDDNSTYVALGGEYSSYYLPEKLSSRPRPSAMKSPRLSTNHHKTEDLSALRFPFKYPSRRSWRWFESKSTKFPRLPWEVLERIIDHCSGHFNTLCCLSATCRQLRPRSQRVTFARVDLTQSKERGVFPFIAFLQANPDLQPLVLSIIVRPTDLGPSLLYLLPNLSSIECISSGPAEAPTLHLHRTSLACFRRLGTRVQTLHLLDVSFSTSLAFVHLLLAFDRLTRLVCTNVVITGKTKGKNSKGPLDAAKRRLCERLRLRSLEVRTSPSL